MDDQITADEYKQLKSGEKTPGDIQEDHKQIKWKKEEEIQNAREFLISRTSETMNIPIESNGEVVEFKIYVRLPRSTMRKHKELMELFNRYLQGDHDALNQIQSQKGDQMVADFLADVTANPELDREFWSRDDIDEQVASQILMTYFTEPFRRQGQIKKFRREH